MKTKLTQTEASILTHLATAPNFVAQTITGKRQLGLREMQAARKLVECGLCEKLEESTDYSSMLSYHTLVIVLKK